MRTSVAMRISVIGAAALCALGLTGLASAVPGAGQPAPLAAEAAAPGTACAPAAWPYASACGTAAAVRTVRVIAVDATPALPGRR